ncbi:MAG TPA: dihydrolipoamide acetyltransferase family protein, partial [Candidatus Binataceae bacterium]|nr:dihydrolipoamide acetyltransferase family protein [Candidatus Binataceae bacterium]
MAIEVTMPKFGLTMHEGTVQRYFKAVGDTVAAGEPLYEVETEKVLYEVESPGAGIFAAMVAAEGATIECGGIVAIIAEPGEDLAAVAQTYRNGSSVARPQASAAAPAPLARQKGDRQAVSPVARKLAAELNVDLATLTGTGPGGRVTREDVERAAGARSSTSPTPAVAAPDRMPLRGVRKIIAERMHQSLRDSAQITITSEIDVTAATEFRLHLKSEFEFTYTDLIVHAVGRALMHHPRMNSRLESGDIVAQPSANVGIAVSLEDGLIVPVLRDVQSKALRQIAVESKLLVEKARSGKLRLEDVTGGTFTVTNLGAWQVDGFTPILNPGETGILGVGRIVEKPVVHNGEIARRAMLTLSLTFDHRV